MPLSRLVVACGCAVSFLLGGTVPVRAEGTLAEAIKAIAGDIKKFIDGRGETAVTVGQFRGSGAFAVNASAGPNLVRELTRELTALKVDVRLQSNITILGDFEEAEDEKSEIQLVILRIVLRERQTGRRTELEQRFVKNQAALAVLLGLTVQFPPEATSKERNEKIKEQLDKPRTSLADTRLRTGDGSPFAIEVLVAPPDPSKDGKRTAKDYEVRRPEDKEGLAFVPIKRDEVYAVRLMNDAEHDVAVSLTIDGLNLFVFSEEKDPKTGGPAYNHLIVPAKSQFLVRGWYINDEQSDEFKVTSYAKSAAAELKNSANVGTITACFHAAWDPKGEPPPGEPKSGDTHSQSTDATGRGARFDEKYEIVERKVGALRGAVSVRYTR